MLSISTWGNNIKTDLKDVGNEEVDWIYLAHDKTL